MMSHRRRYGSDDQDTNLDDGHGRDHESTDDRNQETEKTDKKSKKKKRDKDREVAVDQELKLKKRERKKKDKNDQERKKKKRNKEDINEDEQEEVGDGDGASNEAETQSHSAKSQSTATVPSRTTTMEQQLDRTVFVEGLPYDSNEGAIRDFFEDLLREISSETAAVEEIRLPKWHDTGRLRGYGHVVLASPQLRDSAIAKSQDQRLYLSSATGQQRYVTVKPANHVKSSSATQPATSQEPPSKVLILRNLHYEATVADIEKVMSEFGTIDVDKGSVRIVYDPVSLHAKGFSYVEYRTVEEAQAAFRKAAQQGGIEILGRPCIVDFDHGRVRSSYRPDPRESKRTWSKQYHSKR
jgi:nucleolin